MALFSCLHFNNSTIKNIKHVSLAFAFYVSVCVWVFLFFVFSFTIWKEKHHVKVVFFCVLFLLNSCLFKNYDFNYTKHSYRDRQKCPGNAFWIHAKQTRTIQYREQSNMAITIYRSNAWCHIAIRYILHIIFLQ